MRFLLGRLVDIVKGLKEDKKFGRFVIGEPEMLGISEIGKSSLTLKFGVKTQPGKDNAVKYELLRRIKNTFDELAALRDTEESAAILVSSG